MYIPAFALKQREIEILNHQLGRVVEIKTLSCPIKAFLVEDKVFNEIAKYDAYTTKALKSSYELLDKYYDYEPITTPSYKRRPIETKNLLYKYIKLSDDELKYLIATYRKNDLLRNPESLSDEELKAIIDDQHIQINRKFFQEVLSSRKNSFQNMINKRI